MCGILGYFSFDNNRPDYEQLFLGWQNMIDRGDDGCGFVYKTFDDNGLPILRGVKSKLSSKVFSRDTEGIQHLESLVAALPKVAIFHTRKAAGRHWKKGTTTAHPFYSDKIAIIHNGVIRNDADLEKFYKVKIDVDSAIIPNVFDTYTDDNGELDLKSISETFIGEFAIAALPKFRDELYILCNNERPVHISYNVVGRILYFASEYKFIQPNFDFKYYEEIEELGISFKQYKTFNCEADLLHYSIEEPTFLTISDSGIKRGEFKTQTQVQSAASVASWYSYQHPASTTPNAPKSLSVQPPVNKSLARSAPHAALRNSISISVPEGLKNYLNFNNINL